MLTFFIDEHGPFFADFKALIEEAFTSNGNRSVIIVTHSMGGPMTQVGPLKKTVEQNLTQSCPDQDVHNVRHHWRMEAT